MTKIKDIPVVTLKDMVVYPRGVQPLFIGTEKSIRALEVAQESDEKNVILLVAKIDPNNTDPGVEDLYRTGTFARILQPIKLPDKTVKILVEGLSRADILAIKEEADFLSADVELIADNSPNEHTSQDMVKALMSAFEEYVQVSKKVQPEVMTSLSVIDEPSRLLDSIAAQLVLKLDQKQKILEISTLQDRFDYMLRLLSTELGFVKIDKRIRGRVKNQMEKSQREYYLNEQMKAIQKELGDMEDIPSELEEMQARLESSGMPKEAKEKVSNEINKLKMMSQMSAEATVVRSYIDWMLSTPWKKRSKVRRDIVEAEKVLEACLLYTSDAADE